MDTVNWVSKVLSSSHEEREGDQKDDSCLVMQSKDIVVDAHLVYFDEVAKGAEDVHDVMMVLKALSRVFHEEDCFYFRRKKRRETRDTYLNYTRKRDAVQNLMMMEDEKNEKRLSFSPGSEGKEE